MVAYARAHVMRNSLFEVDSVDYTNQVTKVRFVPETPIQQTRTLIPDGVITDVDSTVWTLELTGVQDNGTGSLGAALRTGTGTSLTVEFQPKVGTGQDKIVAEVMGLPIEFGGEQGAFRTFDVTLPVIGIPVFSQSV